MTKKSLVKRIYVDDDELHRELGGIQYGKMEGQIKCIKET
jgi:hypothetical protein